MAAKNNIRNAIIRSIQPRFGRARERDARPANALIGGTTGGPQYYGFGRGPAVTGSYSRAELEQWFAGAGTSQDRFTTTRLPGGR